MLADYDFDLPVHLIAQEPSTERVDSRLLVLPLDDREAVAHRRFRDLPDLLRPGDLLIFNDSKVIPARLILHKRSGGKVEVMLERQLSGTQLLAKTRASHALQVGEELLLAGQACLRLMERQGDFWLIEAVGNGSVEQLFLQHGKIPLPPYIKRQPKQLDSERYQTVYARYLGSVAAPTAGLHFDRQLMATLIERGIELDFVTLHVGAGTFQPVRSVKIADHHMHSEQVSVTPELAAHVNRVKARGGRVIAVGTTSLRTMESMTDDAGELQAGQRETTLFIYPGYQFKVVDGLITNFHLPKSSLLMLVAALVGRERILAAYHQAIALGYRFFSYGDAMLIN